MTTQGSSRSRMTGFTLVEAMVVVVLLSLISAGIFRTTSMVIRSVRVNNNIRAANNQLQQQIENIRGMDYYRIGVRPGTGVAYMNRYVTKTNDVYDATNDVLLVSRIVLADSGTASTNGNILATMTTYATPVDDPVDGLGGADADHDTNDAMRVRAEIAWVDLGKTYTRSLETMVYGIMSNDEPIDTAGVAPEDDPSTGDGDEGVVDILKAEWDGKAGDSKAAKLKVEATASGKDANLNHKIWLTDSTGKKTGIVSRTTIGATGSSNTIFYVKGSVALTADCNALLVIYGGLVVEGSVTVKPPLELYAGASTPAIAATGKIDITDKLHTDGNGGPVNIKGIVYTLAECHIHQTDPYNAVSILGIEVAQYIHNCEWFSFTYAPWMGVTGFSSGTGEQSLTISRWRELPAGPP